MRTVFEIKVQVNHFSFSKIRVQTTTLAPSDPHTQLRVQIRMPAPSDPPMKSLVLHVVLGRFFCVAFKPY